ncbi:MAG TPA: hypothetical protein VE907_19730 [Gammaproteobacteria bacterium]|nr:hypothetical protein [Gammaproteobacteria bacterium]
MTGRKPIAKKRSARAQTTSRRRKGPARLSTGEKLLRLLLADIASGRIIATHETAGARLNELAAAARRMLNGEHPREALQLDDGGRRNDYHRDRDIALLIHSERSRRRAWKLVDRHVNAWMATMVKSTHVDPRDRARYGVRLALPTLKQIYSEHRTLCEAWNLRLPDLGQESNS